MEVDKVFIIAEAGVNHNGSIKLAKKLIDIAASAGADAVKFQTFKAKNLTSKHAPKAQYQNLTTNPKESQFDMIKKLELDYNAHKELIAYCNLNNIMFLSSPFDHDSINLLHKLGLKIFKIPSGEITNLPYLEHIGSLKKRVILSTGMSNLNEIEDALNVLIYSGTTKENISILHANTMYPTPMEDVNLNAMVTIKNKFNVSVGYSDHTLGIEVDCAAVALGATIIEKHFTCDKNDEGPDHQASLDSSELKLMVSSIRNIENALGDGQKRITKSESANKDISRKSIVAKCSIRIGEELNERNITTKRPGNGVSPMKWNEISGSIAKKNYKTDELIIMH